MTDDNTAIWVPDECTLPTAERPLRRSEFDDLFAASVAVERHDERHARFQLAGADDLAGRVRDLTARENDCCAFFTFTVTSRADGVDFDIEVPVGHVDVLDALVARAVQLSAGR